MNPTLPPKIALALLNLQEPALQAREKAMRFAAQEKEKLSNQCFDESVAATLVEKIQSASAPINQSLKGRGFLGTLKDFLAKPSATKLKTFTQKTLASFPMQGRSLGLEVRKEIPMPPELWITFLLGLLCVLAEDKGQLPATAPTPEGQLKLIINGPLIHLHGSIDSGTGEGNILREMDYWFPYPKSIAPGTEGAFHLIFDFSPGLTETSYS
jgi:hypothetical protein